MKKLLVVLPAIMCLQLLYAQNVGIGTNAPDNKLQVAGNLLVTSPSVVPLAAPTVAQTKTMVNGDPNTIFFPVSDSTGRMYDPGGPSGNYLAGLTADAAIGCCASNNVAIEINIESIGLGTGDSLIIRQSSGNPVNLLAIGNGYTTPGKWVFEGAGLYILFKSNGDASTGIGFSILFKRLYVNSATLPDIQNAVGNSMYFNSKTGAFRAGYLNNSNRGTYSAAFGSFTEATGSYSFAAGYNTTAAGGYSTALGITTTASAYGSVAMGNGASASGFASVAMGNGANATSSGAVALGSGAEALGSSSFAVISGTASGLASVAIGSSAEASGNNAVSIGRQSTASGNYSTVMGNNTTAAGENATAMGLGTYAFGFAGTAVGMYNHPLLLGGQPTVTSTTPLFIIGNGDNSSSLSNAMVVLKNGNVGIGENSPDASLHITHAGGGGIILQNSSDNNKWRIYSASGDNNLTFYNNANTEIADIDDVTGTFNALSDARYKKDIENMPPVLAMLMRLKPKYYHFNWQDKQEQKQIGLLAQEAYKLFPELVSYDKQKDLYKMNYAGFSTVAIKAIQEQQQEIQELKARLEKLEALLLKRQ